MLKTSVLILTLFLKLSVIFWIVYHIFKNKSRRMPTFAFCFFLFDYLFTLLALSLVIFLYSPAYPYLYYLDIVFQFGCLFPKIFGRGKNECLGFLIWEYTLQFYLEMLWICCIAPFFFPGLLTSSNISLFIMLSTVISFGIVFLLYKRNPSKSILPNHILIFPTMNLILLEIMLMTFPHNHQINLHFLVTLIGFLLLTFLTIGYIIEIHRLDQKQEDMERLQISSQALSRQYQYLSEEYGKLRSVEHDISNQLLTIEILQKQGHYEQAKILSRQLLEKIESLNETQA